MSKRKEPSTTSGSFTEPATVAAADVHPVLRLPELCVAIFQHLDSPSLATAARVCRAWFGAAVSVLWRSLSAFDVVRVQPRRRRLYQTAVRQLSVRHAAKHDQTYHFHIYKLLLADDDDGNTAAYADHTALASTDSLVPWRFTRLRRLAYLHCGAWRTDGGNRGGSSSNSAREIPALLARCGPHLTSVVLTSCFTCNNRWQLPAVITWDLPVPSIRPYVLPAAALHELARRTRLEELECSLVLRRRAVDAVCGRFAALRKLHAHVQSRSAVRSLVGMIAGAATMSATRSNDDDDDDGGERPAAAPVLTELQLKLERRDFRPFAHLLAPLACRLRRLRLVVAHPPGQTPFVAGADLAALGQMTQLRELFIEATTTDRSGVGDSDGEADEDQDDDDHDEEPPSNQPGTPAQRPLPPTDTDMLALVAPLPQLESLELELAESHFSAHIHADIGRCCPKLTRLRLPAPLDFDALPPRTGPPLFPALVDLFARNVAADHSFDTRPSWELHWHAENRVRTLRYHAPALKELSMSSGLSVVELMINLFKRGDEEEILPSIRDLWVE